jgi:hypothetical protein
VRPHPVRRVAPFLWALLLAVVLPPGGAEAQYRSLVPDAPELQGRVTIHYAPGAEGQAERTARVLARNPRLPGLPPDVPSRAEIVLAGDAEAWDVWTGGEVPHWGAGVAIPSEARIVMPLFRTAWTGGVSEDRTLRHEWAHLGLHEYLQGLRIPRWFDEGYAQWASGGWDASAAWKLRVALARGTAPPLADLTLVWPRDRADAELAYLLSASAVSYLVGDSGARGMEIFLERWRESRDFDAAFRGTFGMTPGVFETRWVDHVGRRYGWVVFLSQTMVLWGIFATVLLALWFLRRRRDRERMEALRRAEAGRDPGDSWWSPFDAGRGRRPPVDPPPPGE